MLGFFKLVICNLDFSTYPYKVRYVLALYTRVYTELVDSITSVLRCSCIAAVSITVPYNRIELKQLAQEGRIGINLGEVDMTVVRYR